MAKSVSTCSCGGKLRTERYQNVIWDECNKCGTKWDERSVTELIQHPLAGQDTMAGFYNTLSVAMMGYNPELDEMSNDALRATDEIRSMFVDFFRSATAYNQKGGVVFKDGSTWHPMKFENSKGKEY